MGTARDKELYLDGALVSSKAYTWEDQGVPSRGLRDLERIADSYHEWNLSHYLSMVIDRRDCVAAKHLLDAGVHPESRLEEFLGFAFDTRSLREAAFPIATLLRKYGSPLSPELQEQIELWIDHFSRPRRQRMTNSQRILGQLRKILHPPYEERAKLCVYYFADFDPSVTSPEIAQSWPPDLLPDVDMPDLRGPILDYWDTILSMRRAEAKVLAPFNWKRLRLLVKMRSTALYWQEETQKRLCAPGGAGRAEDLAAYRDDPATNY